MSQEPFVRVEREGEIAVVTISNPPLNAISAIIRQDLLEAITSLRKARDVIGVVLIGDGKNFIAGSDIREFGKPLVPPELPDIIAAIEEADQPFVAAIAGAALGGGYELALGCDARIATSGAAIGLPEVTLGMIPGAGGTQRLPRLVGIATAIELISAGTRLSGLQARRCGMIDHLAAQDLRSEAIALARSLAGTKDRVSERAIPADRPGEIERAVTEAMRRGRGRPPVVAAIDVVKSSQNVPFEQALANERTVFQKLRLEPEADALRYIFFAERRAGRSAGKVATDGFKTLGIVGAGTMGVGIAATALRAGLTVKLVDLDDGALSRGLEGVHKIIDRWVVKGEFDKGEGQDCYDRLEAHTELEPLASCDGVLEAIVESMDAKSGLFRSLDALLRKDALLISNTSYLDLDVLANSSAHPERVLGLHFFNPAQIMRVVEVVRTSRADQSSINRLVAVARRMGKLPVITAVGHGFIGNRIYAAYRRQCEFLLEEGLYPEHIDQALESFGFAMGPFATGDLSGLDIAWAMRRAQAATRDPNARYVTIPDSVCELGRLGRKTGMGWYRYSEGFRRGEPDPVIHDLIDTAFARRGITRRDFEPEDIVKLILATMVNEAALLFAENIAEKATDIDVVMVNGLAFPRHVGGIVFWALKQTPEKLEHYLDQLAAMNGASFVRGDIPALLAALDKESP